MSAGITKYITTQKYHAFYFQGNKKVLIGIYETENEALEARKIFNEDRADEVKRTTKIKRNAPRIERINKILELSNGITPNELSAILDLNVTSLCRDLSVMVNIGYLSLEVIKKGAYNQPQNHYTKLKDKFDMADIDILLAEVLSNKQGGRTGGRGRNAKELQPTATIESAVVYGMSNPDLADAYLQQAKQMRKDYKSPKNYANGNSMAMF